jgi:hypothetical protein
LERGKYDLQTIIFWGMKNEENIADIELPEKGDSSFASGPFNYSAA